MNRWQRWSFAVLTLVGVPAVSVIVGGASAAEWAVPLGVSLAALLLIRPPVVGLAVSAVLIISWRSANLTETGWIWPATFAYVAAVLGGRSRWAVGIGVVQLAFAFQWAWVVNENPSAETLGPVGVEALWLAATLAAATAYRNWQHWQGEVVARLRQEARDREEAAGRRQAEERLTVAQELHDVVAHTLAVVGVQLNVAADALDTAPDETREALRVAQRVRGAAMADLASLVTVLRTGEPGGHYAVGQHNGAGERVFDGWSIVSPAGLSRLDELVGAVRMTGLEVMFLEEGDRSRVPAPVALALTRVVQESLTNVVRHADATRVDVTLHYGSDDRAATVIDDGRAGTSWATGHGITGMRERVAALGGTFEAGPVDAGGFRVYARIPG